MVTRLDSSEGNRVILRPNEGLTLETDVGFETLYGGQFTLSTQLIIQKILLYYRTDTAQQSL